MGDDVLKTLQDQFGNDEEYQWILAEERVFTRIEQMLMDRGWETEEIEIALMPIETMSSRRRKMLFDDEE